MPPVSDGSFGPCPCRAMGQAGGPNTALGLVSCRHGHGGLRAVSAHGPCQMSVLRAVPAAHGPDGNLYF
jgi:hypothetical protein